MPNSSKSHIESVITTLLAWIGLAGLADGLVVWKDWFEAGLMEHWRSVKVWVIAICFDWLPFQPPLWVLDYILLGALLCRAFGRNDYEGELIPVFDLSEGYSFRRRSGFYFFNFLVYTILWPLILILAIRTYRLTHWNERRDQINRTKGLHSVFGRNSPSIRSNLRRSLIRFLLFFVSFIPILFVISNVLYDYG